MTRPRRCTNQRAATVPPRTSGEHDPAGAEAGRDGTRDGPHTPWLYFFVLKRVPGLAAMRPLFPGDKLSVCQSGEGPLAARDSNGLRARVTV